MAVVYQQPPAIHCIDFCTYCLYKTVYCIVSSFQYCAASEARALQQLSEHVAWWDCNAASLLSAALSNVDSMPRSPQARVVGRMVLLRWLRWLHVLVALAVLVSCAEGYTGFDCGQGKAQRHGDCI